MVCGLAGPEDEREIERSTPPPPTNPETRAAKEIAYLEGLLEVVAAHEIQRIRKIRQQIELLNQEVERWTPEPVRVYRPDPKLKGGLG